MGLGMAGEYLGFGFNGYHSSWFGITRTSDGDRYNADLLPTKKEITQEMPGMHGLLYFGETYSKREFSISFAFDSMTEEQYTALTKWLDEPDVKPLFFDESPHKEYSAKVTGKATIKHLTFDDENGNKVYKGSGSVQFVCYFPFARAATSSSSSVIINNNSTIIYRKKNNTTTTTFRTFGSGSENIYVDIDENAYNAMTGTSAKAPAPIYITGAAGAYTITVENRGTITISGLPSSCTIDGYQCLIYDNNGNIYNDKITNGDFFWLLPNDPGYDTYTETLYY